jgi:hypothetical protein
MDICPVADPKMVTDMQRMTHAQLLMQIQEHPVFGKIQNPEEALRRVYEAAGTEEPDKLIVKQQGPSPAEQAQLEELTVQDRQERCQRAQGRSAGRQDAG